MHLEIRTLTHVCSLTMVLKDIAACFKVQIIQNVAIPPLDRCHIQQTRPKASNRYNLKILIRASSSHPTEFRPHKLRSDFHRKCRYKTWM